MTRPALAKLAAIPYSTLAGIENGDQASSTRLHAIAKALGVRVEYLETGKEPKTGPVSARPAAEIDVSLLLRTDQMLKIALDDDSYDLAKVAKQFAAIYAKLAVGDEPPTAQNVNNSPFGSQDAGGRHGVGRDTGRAGTRKRLPSKAKR